MTAQRESKQSELELASVTGLRKEAGVQGTEFSLLKRKEKRHCLGIANGSVWTWFGRSARIAEKRTLTNRRSLLFPGLLMTV